jgi:hypothetical protein
MHGKGTSIISSLYVIGMSITVIGFIVPIFSAFGGTITLNGFELAGKGDSVMKFALLLVFFGAIAGIVFQFFTHVPLLKLIALIVTVAGGLYCFFNTSDIGVKLAGKFLGSGFYMIIIGWCVAAAGLFLDRK